MLCPSSQSNPPVSAQPAMTTNNESSVESVTSNFSAQPAKHVLQSTAVIKIINPTNNKEEFVRCLLGDGSDSSFISEHLMKKLGLESIPTSPIQVIGIGNLPSYVVKQKCVARIESLHSEFNVTLTFSVLPELTGNAPRSTIDYNRFKIPPNIQLADPTFNVSSPIDALIGADLFWHIIDGEKRSLGDSLPFLIKSQLGWLIGGPLLASRSDNIALSNRAITSYFVTNKQLDDKLCRFWELEEIPTKRPLLSEEEKAFTAQLKSGCFNLRKFKSNAPDIFPQSNIDLQSKLCLSESASALGMGWCPQKDNLYFSIETPNPDDTKSVTKRSILSSSFSIFDPLGLLSPCTVTPKLLLQRVWARGLAWDAPLPDDLRREWGKLVMGLRHLQQVTPPRRVFVVLAWLRSTPSKLKSFVANKVIEICENTSLSSWRHVPTALNPADYISRGIPAEKLPDLRQWWSGPSFLAMDPTHWPVPAIKKRVDDNSPEESEESLPEMKVLYTSKADDNDDTVVHFERFSNFYRLERTYAYVLRFIHNLKNKMQNCLDLSTDELRKSFSLLAREAQKQSFPKEYQALSKGQVVGPRSKILSLSPFINEDKVLLVGGRLDRSTYTYSKKHPIILDSKHHLTKLIFQHRHVQLMHAGPQLLLYSIRESIWPVSGRRLARSIVNACTVCRRFKGQTLAPKMGSLPPERIMPAPVFQSVAMDDSQDSDGLSVSGSKRKMDSGSQIAKKMKNSRDPAEFRSHLTSTQAALLEDHTSKERERLIQTIQTRVQEKIASLGVTLNRNVVTLCKVRVAGVTEKNGNIQVSRALLSIWRPNEAVMEIIKEGTWIEIMNVVPTAMRYSELQLSAGRQSIFSHSKHKESEKVKPLITALKRTCYQLKDLVKNPAMTTEYNEIDTVGIIFEIDPTVNAFDEKKHQFQNVYLTDLDKNMISVNFWGGLKKFGFENVLDTGQIVACTNLQKRAGNSRKNIPQYRVTEFSYFTKTPKSESARNIFEELSQKLLKIDKKKFCEECVNVKTNYSIKQQTSENVTPYRFPNFDMNSSKNILFIDSPLNSNKKDENLNLSGLDFESTFKQDTQDLSPKTLLRKRQVKEKIAKLKRYGEPPPLSPIQIINKSKHAASAFKSPFSKSDITPSAVNCVKTLPNQGESSLSVASSVTNLPNQGESSPSVAISVKNLQNQEEMKDIDIQCSPVIALNRTYVKRTNPVKLNFSKNDSSLNEAADDFAEEFDCSPPLSLD
ncbi:BRCA2, oligonucleotide/oligosaccharide-binding, domain 3 domain-containing protein [Phthorimaea operculella]|nr:BRCA2, oligonucleotide/oligosaccharide-binding, domain 3 domain-containing protein [Phthorimaea operculella]